MAVAKKSIITLYAGNCNVYDHRVRVALAEKGVLYDYIKVNAEDKLSDFFTLNPSGELPTLVDRDLILYNHNIILEYLDERFPHPPLLPVYPVMRARLRLMINRIDFELQPIIAKLTQGKPAECKQAAREMQDFFRQILPLLANSTYFISEEFTIVDCCLGPIIWRFPQWNIDLGEDSKTLMRYANNLFARSAFKASLTEQELCPDYDLTCS